ncbi:MAG TPA: DUF6263 family protein [Pirellulales bacterium]|jgi:hypothetical protein|nr:DUF6263 family protein [Pirellulales bacterium]
MQIRVRTLRLFSLALALLAVGASALAESELRWKFKPGEKLQYVIERSAEGKVNLTGAEFAFKMGMTFDTTWNVKAVAADGTADLEQTVDRIQIGMSSPLAGSVNFDSKSTEKPDAGPVWTLLEPVVSGMLGQTIKIKVTPQGKVTDIQLPDKLTESFAKQRVGQNRQAGLGVGGNAFTEKGVKELITRSVQLLPEKSDKSWSQSFENVMPGVGTQTTELKFSRSGDESVDGKKLEKIAQVTELTFEPAADARAELEITGQEGSGTIYFDAAAGHTIKSSGKQTTSMELSGPQELTQEISETSSMRLGTSPDKPAEKKEAAKK